MELLIGLLVVAGLWIFRAPLALLLGGLLALALAGGALALIYILGAMVLAALG